MGAAAPKEFPLQRVLQGEIVEVERSPIPVTRHGYDEEAFFSFTFSPLRDDSGEIAGILQIVSEMTEAVLAERRERLLRALAPSMDLHELTARADRVLSALQQDPDDIPWAVLFLRGEAHEPLHAHPVVAPAPGDSGVFTEEELHDARDIAERVLQSGAPIELDPWNASRGRLVALPLRRTEAEQMRGVILLGASARLRFDDRYREFFRRIAREITNHLVVLQELALSEQLKLALDSAKLGTWVLDIDRRRIRISDRTAAFLGPLPATEYDFDQLNRQAVHPEDLDRVEATWRAAVEQHALYSCEYRVVRPDGEVRWLSSWGRATYAPDGRARTLSGVSLDITDTKKLVLELSAAIRARDEFLSIASHELKTPLTSMTLHLQGQLRLLRRAPPEPGITRLLQQLDKQTARLSRLVEDMLDVSRISMGRLEVVRVRTELGAVVGEIVERLRPQFDAAAVPLRVQTGANLFVEADPDRLEQVVLNLLTNALRYGNATPVQVTVSQVEGKTRLAVRDEGRGLSAESQKRIFERFERAVSATEVSGFGLGLFIAREIVQRHEGRIWVESELGKGSTFFVELPLVGPSDG